MSVLQSTVIQRVRDILQDNPWAVNNTSNVSSTTTTTIAVADGTRWDEGAILEFQDNGEQCYVVSVSGNNLTVIRGYNGTTAATHNGSVTPILTFRDPTFTYKRIQDSIELVVQSMWPYVYKHPSTTITPVAGTVWYDLVSTAMGLIQVGQLSATSPYTYYAYGKKGTRRPVAFLLNAPTTLAASGVAIGFPRGFALTTTTVKVDYAAKLTTGTSGSPASYSDFDDGLQAECIAYGAAARLTMQSDIQRVTSEDINMGDSSVQPGMRTRVGQMAWQQHVYYRGLWQEELRRNNPIMAMTNYATSSSAISSNYVGSNQPF